MRAALRVISITPGQEEEVIELDAKDRFTVGRENDQSRPDISFPGRNVSREHAILEKIGNEYYIENLSANVGLGIDCKPLALNKKRILNPGEIICLNRNARVQFIAEYDAAMTFGEVKSCIYNQDCIFDKKQFDGVKVPASNKDDAAQKLINTERQEVLINDYWVHLDGNKWELIKMLCEKRDQIVTHDEIINTVWHNADGINENNVRSLIKHLRKDIGDNQKPYKYIFTRPNGYMFNTRR
jgi:hypothetical protein